MFFEMAYDEAELDYVRRIGGARLAQIAKTWDAHRSKFTSDDKFIGALLALKHVEEHNARRREERRLPRQWEKLHAAGRGVLLTQWSDRSHWHDHCMHFQVYVELAWMSTRGIEHLANDVRAIIERRIAQLVAIEDIDKITWSARWTSPTDDNVEPRKFLYAEITGSPGPEIRRTWNVGVTECEADQVG